MRSSTSWSRTRWSRTTICASPSRASRKRAPLRRDSAFDLAPSINAGGGYTKTAHREHQHAAGCRARKRVLRRRLRRVLGARLLRPRAPRSRGQQRGARCGRGRRTRRAGDRHRRSRAHLLRAARPAERLDVARRNVENQKATLDLTQVRLDAGSGTEFDTSRAQAQLSATLGTIAPLEAAVARSIHRLSVLVRPRTRCAARRARSSAEPAAAAGHRARGRSGRIFCAAVPTSASPSASSPVPRRESASQSRTSSRASLSPATQVTWPRIRAASAIPARTPTRWRPASRGPSSISATSRRASAPPMAQGRRGPAL